MARALLEAYPGRAALLAHDAQVVAVNNAWSAAAANSYSLLQTVAVGANYSKVCAEWVDSSAEEACGALHAVLAGEAKERGFEFTAQTDAGPAHFLARFVALDTDQDFVLVAHHDISRLHETERERAQLERALTRSEDIRDEVLTLVSHELRTPLTGVRGNAEVLVRRGAKLPEMQRVQALRDIERDAERLRQVVENMLILANRETGGIPGQDEPILVQRVVPRAVEEHSVRHPESTVRVELADDLPAVLGDEEHLRQILANLLSNAAKYGSPGTVVDIVARVERDRLVTEIANEGIGIPVGDLTSVWEPFARGSNVVEGTGIGLGLPVCRSLAMRHGAEVDLINRHRPTGAIARLVMPLVRELP
ncbi:hypothetical protein AYO38_02435 [bacterium SCGC AG-212-C10]|nr:hypothetical protein AYO38_02435 [bacterium SCGC AG-212-C10]